MVATDDLIEAGCRYRAPFEGNALVLLNVYQDECDEWTEMVRSRGLHATAGPIMRSSYRTGDMFKSEHLAYGLLLR